jgi:hypothetical protein
MKRLMLLLLLTPLFAMAQTFTFPNLKIVNNQVIFQKVYPCNGMNADQVKAALLEFVPGIRFFSLSSVTDNRIIGFLESTQVNVKKYGGNRISASAVANDPMTASVIFEWKDGRYRVTVSNVIFHGGPQFGVTDLTAGALSSDGTWSTKAMVQRSCHFVDAFLDDIMTLKPAPADNW